MFNQYSVLPRRMAGVLSAMFANGGRENNAKKMAVIDSVLADERLPLTANTGAIYRAADHAAREVFKIAAKMKTSLAIKIQIDELCKQHGINIPTGSTDKEIFKKALDKNWWVRKLTKEHMRRFEHTSIQLGLTGKGGDEYISREVALMQKRRNAANKKLLESITLTNGLDNYTLAQLADLGMANKTLRRGELMTRIRGFEEIANELNHVAMFWTITCPSKFHSVGGTNKKYNGATPRTAQAYLCKIWSRMRAAFNREDIRPYGFRIAEPHTDGCPHWHMLFFVDRKDAARMEQIIKAHALAEDAGEWESEENRVKLVNIETSNGMSAAGYIVKYISKNIDGHGVGDHKAFKDGETYIVKTDLLGNEEILPSQRVTYWSQVWGIRQFQQIGGAPIGVWRELRRVSEEAIHGAPEEVAAAWAACQKTAVSMEIDCAESPTGKKTVTQASFANYLKAQGGVQTGRDYKVRIQTEDVTVVGKYATYTAKKPIGVYGVSSIGEIIKSVRYVWAVVGCARTGVNNCTEPNFKNSTECEKSTVPNFKKRTEPSAEFESWKKELWERVEKTKNFRFADNFDEMVKRRTYEH